MKDAVQYSINQKEYLCRFLTDGNIPIDNGSSERHIRPLAVGRRNFLFCNTVEGANALAIMYSIVETARANNANVRCYISYLLEQVPKYLDGTDLSFLPSMMPWSEAYRDYEYRYTHCIPPDPVPYIFTEKPVSPRKRSPRSLTWTMLPSQEQYPYLKLFHISPEFCFNAVRDIHCAPCYHLNCFLPGH